MSMKLEYFGGHGRAVVIRMAFHYAKQDFVDETFAGGFEEFGKNKAAGKYKYGSTFNILWMQITKS